KITICFVIISLGIIIYQAATNTNAAHSNAAGAPYGYAGDPAGGHHNCTSCHFGPSPATQSGWITSTVPGSGYVPGSTYTVTATATAAGHIKFGFEVSPQNSGGTYLGTLVNTSSQTQLVGLNHYITQTSNGNCCNSGSHTWTFNWVAPNAGSGDVTFYGAFNVTNNNTFDTGDTIYLSTLVISECAAPS